MLGMKAFLCILALTLTAASADSCLADTSAHPPVKAKAKAKALNQKPKLPKKMAPTAVAPVLPPSGGGAELHLELRPDPTPLSPASAPSGKIELPATTGTGFQSIQLDGTQGSTERYTPSGPPGILRGLGGPNPAAPGARF